MKETSNYQLNQWEKTDRILMEDFNRDNARIDAALAAAGNCRIATGSYLGTGTWGEANKNTLTFDFTPRAVLIMANGANFVLNSDAANWVLLVRGVTAYNARYASNNTNGTSYAVEWEDRGVSWYATNRPTATEWAGGQLNLSDTTYHYIAIG